MDEFNLRQQRSFAQFKPAAVGNSLLHSTSSVSTCPHCWPTYNLNLPRMQDFKLPSYHGSTRISEFYFDVNNCWLFRNFRGELYFRSIKYPRSWYYQHPQNNVSVVLCEIAALDLDQTYGRILPPLVDTAHNWLHRGYVKWYRNGCYVVSFSPEEYHKQSADQSSRMTNNPQLGVSPSGFSALSQVPDIHTRDMDSSQHQRANQTPLHKYSISCGQSYIDPNQTTPVPRFQFDDSQDSSSILPLAIPVNSLQLSHAVANATSSEKSAKPVIIDEHLQEETQKGVQRSGNGSHKATTRYQVHETSRFLENESSCLSQTLVTVKQERDRAGASSFNEDRTLDNVTKSAKDSNTLVTKHKTVIKTEVIKEVSKFHGSRSRKVKAGSCLEDNNGQENVSQSKAASTASIENNKTMPKTLTGNGNGTKVIGVRTWKNTKMDSITADNTLASNNNSATFIRKFDVPNVNVFALPPETKSETGIGHLSDGDSAEFDISEVQLLSLNPESESESESEYESKSEYESEYEPISDYESEENSSRELDISEVDILPLAPKFKTENNQDRKPNALESVSSMKKNMKSLPLTSKSNPHNEAPSTISDDVKSEHELQRTPTSANKRGSVTSLDFPDTSQPPSSTNQDTDVQKTPSEDQQPKAKDMNGTKSLCEIQDHQPEDPFEYVCKTCELKHQFKLPSSDDLARVDSQESSRLKCFYYSNENRLWYFQNFRLEVFFRLLHGPPTWYFKPPFCMQQELCVHYGYVLEDVYGRFIQAFSNLQTMDRFPENESFFTTERKPGTQLAELLHDVQRHMQISSVSGNVSSSVTRKDAEVQVEIHLVDQDERRETTERKPRADQVERQRLKEAEDSEPSSNHTQPDSDSSNVSVSNVKLNESQNDSCLSTTTEEQKVNLHSILSTLEFLSFNPVEKTFSYSNNTSRGVEDKAT